MVIKKISIILSSLFLSIMGICNVKAESYDSYKFGDKVIFGDFGGHVIKDSDSSSSTVTVYVDGWNKTKDEWYNYWSNKASSVVEIQSIFKNMEAYYKGQLDNLNGFQMVSSNLEYLKTLVDVDYVSEYEIVINNAPDWLLYENFNIFAGGKSFDFDNDVGFTIETLAIGRWYIDGVLDEYDDLFRYNIFYDEKKQSVVLDMDFFGGACGTIAGLACYIQDVPIITMDKSNVEKVVDKCEGYSEEYTINYNTDGVIELNNEKVSGTKMLTNPTKEGYIFEGWYLDSNFSKKVTEVTSTQKFSTTGCLEGYNDVIVFAKWKKELKNNDVSLIADKKILDDLSLKVEKLEDKKLEELVADALEKVVMYDINLLNELNEKVQPTSKVKVIVPIPEDYDKNNLVVYRIENEELIEYPVTINGNSAEIQTDHFSVYVLGEKKIVEDTKDEEVTNPEEDETNKEETKDEEVSKDEIKNPETGDNVILYIGLGFVITICSLMIIKKLKLSK